jgi:predicted NUDIX family NTP pyrophosphohydrolase
MAKRSAGLLLYRTVNDATEVLLVHPGGPYWARRDEGAWSLPKGEIEGGEDPLEVARREFGEELGTDPPDGPVAALGEIRQAGGKLVTAWALQGQVDADAVRSNTFSLEWPPRSGTIRDFPEVDRAEWFPLDAARAKMLEGQRPFLDRLAELLDEGGSGPRPGQPRRSTR